MQKDASALPPIAIVGIGTMFPGRGTTVGFWRDIVEGHDAVREVPRTHWLIDDYYDPDPKAPDKTYCKRGAFIPAFPFDPVEFGIPPNVIEATDTFQLLALYVAKQVLAEASNTRFGKIDRERTSVVMGVAVGSELMGDMAGRLYRPIWMKALREEGVEGDEALAICERISSHFTQWRESTFPGLLGNVVAGRITNRLDLGGTNFTADAACASSIAALRHAAMELWLGESDLVLTGGADALNNAFMYMCFSKTPALSATGDCRPFSDRADGTILGEGSGIFALRRLADAERDGNHIYGVIRGIGASSDARANSVYAPRAEGQALAVRRAYQQAGYSPRSVELLEGHGTGTRAGDAAEFGGLAQVFKVADSEARQWCALGSIKSQIGHTKSAAGAAGLAKAVLSLHHKVLPPTLKIEQPSAKLDIETSPFYLNTQARPWIHDPATPRRASVSSFGFGGSNFHVALEEYRGPAAKPPRFRAFPAELILLSHETATGLVAAAQAFAQKARHDHDLPGIAAQSCTAFDAKAAHRLALVVASIEDLQARVAEAIPHIESGRAFATPDAVYAFGPGESGKTAFLFSGQGSQYVSMGGALAMAFDEAREPFDQIAASPLFEDEPLHQIVFPKPVFSEAARAAQAAALTATENAQPAIAAVQLSQLALLQRFAIKADAVAGHSFGEVMALHAAGCFDSVSAFRLARRRGLAMRDAARGTQGAMLAVALDIAQVRDRLANSRSKAVVGNDNGPRQVILSGTVADIELAAQEFTAAGVAVTRLPVATAFHSPIVAGAVDAMRAAIGEIAIAAPQLPVYANATAARYPGDPASIGAQLAAQISEPVRFRELVEALYRDGVQTFVEVGPSAVLTGLVGQTLGSRPHLAVSCDNKWADGLVQFLRMIGRLAVSGMAIDAKPLTEGWRGLEARPVPPKHAVWLCGANYNKPYPPKEDAAATEPFERLVRQAKTATPIRLPATEPDKAVQENVGKPVNVKVTSFENGSFKDDSFKDIVAAPPVGSDVMRQTSRASAADRIERTPMNVIEMAPAVTRDVSGGLSEAPMSRAVTAEPVAKSFALSTMQFQTDEDEMSRDAVLALQTMQASINAEHRRFLEILSQSHMAFLRVCESTLAQVRAVGGEIGQDLAKSPALAMPMERPALSNGTAQDAFIMSAPSQAAAAGHDTRDLPEMTPPANESLLERLNAAKLAEVQDAIVVPPVAAAVTPSTQLAEIVREVVAEKTGYPTDMLDLDMELESELGVDSIKQVEILAGLRERLPQLPEIAPARLAELRTLRQIAEALAPEATTAVTKNGANGHASTGAATSTAISVAVVAAPAAAPALNAAPAADLAAIVREVVAEKTGYPTDMLELDMELESELGVDSIKQVEILAGLRERLPQLPEIAPARLAELRTLRQIAEALAPEATTAVTKNGANGHASASAATSTAMSVAVIAAPVAAPASNAAPIGDLAAIVREVVAEKTGYPTDMLDLDMELEAELGVDSIKQVEILAGLRERLPQLPEIAPARLAELRTLRQIAEALAPAAVAPAVHAAPIHANGNGANGNGAAHNGAAPIVAAPAPVEAQSSKATPVADLANIVREVVAEKTGYPTDMLDLDMELEAELGVDSIKQVEILAGLRERLPQLPEIAPARLTELRTLRQIAEALAPESIATADANLSPTPRCLDAAADDDAKKNGIFRQVVELDDCAPSGKPMSGFDGRARIAVTAENGRLGEALAAELNRRGLDAIVGLETRPDATAVISTAGLSTYLDPESVHLAGFRAAHAFAARADAGGAFVVLQDTGGRFGRGLTDIAQAWRGGLTGLAKTARFEWPEVAVKAIDIECGALSDQELARRIADEVLNGGRDIEVGLPESGGRFVPMTRIVPLGMIGESRLRDGSVILVSGGGRGVTAESILGLAGLIKARFILLGRTELIDWPADIAPDLKGAELRTVLAKRAMSAGQKPNPREIRQYADRLLASRDIQATVARLEALGSETLYRAIDVTDAGALKALVQEIRGRFGAVNGLVHGAGVLADKLIKDKTEAQVAQVFRTKVTGLAALLQALDGEPLEFVNLFASIAGRFGNPGQADYAMANEVLNRVAWVLAAQRPNCRVSAINWGPWDGGMVDDFIRAQFSARGVPIIPLSVGVDAFVREIAAGSKAVETVVSGPFEAAGVDLAASFAAQIQAPSNSHKMR